MRRRRAIGLFITCVAVLVLLAGAMPQMIEESLPNASDSRSDDALSGNTSGQSLARAELDTLATKGRAPKTGYSREKFGNGWATVNGCSTRDIILYRDLSNTVLDESCKVTLGTLNDPYTGKEIAFNREQSSAVQIDHVVALSDAWQKGAQNLSSARRVQLANDPLELLAVYGPANQQKADGDAATWLPSNKGFRCQYVARQIAVKKKYELWVTMDERRAMENILKTCPEQLLP